MRWLRWSWVGAVALAVSSPVWAEGNAATVAARKAARERVAKAQKENAEQGDAGKAETPKKGGKGDRGAKGAKAGKGATAPKAGRAGKAAAAPRANAGERGAKGGARKPDAAETPRERHEIMTGEPRHPTASPGVNRRERRQAVRIADGIRTGALTRDEAEALVTKERALAEKEAAYKADGTLTVDERKDLHQNLNALSRDIYEQKHDGDAGLSLKQTLKARIESGELTGAEAREVSATMRQIYELRRQLGKEGVGDEQRNELLGKLEAAVNTIFERTVMEAAEAAPAAPAGE